MRIISGKYKGLTLYSKKDDKLRPTTDRVKEALFSIINASLSEARVLDLFSGTGQLGLEALSRGALEVVFVDISTAVLKKNCQLMSRQMHDVQNASITIIQNQFKKFLQRNTKIFDIIFLDPPWDKTGYYEDALKAISEFDILAKEGIICCEHRKKIKIEVNSPLKKLAEYNYGDTSLTFLKL